MIGSITYAERRGVLSYRVGDEVKTFEGWVYADGGKTIARRVGGRNRWFICRSEDVVWFEEFVRPAMPTTNYSGHIASRRARATGTTVVLLRGPESGMTEYPFITLCDDHGGVCEFETRRSAETFLSHPDEWCPTCQEVAR